MPICSACGAPRDLTCRDRVNGPTRNLCWICARSFKTAAEEVRKWEAEVKEAEKETEPA